MESMEGRGLFDALPTIHPSVCGSWDLGGMDEIMKPKKMTFWRPSDIFDNVNIG